MSEGLSATAIDLLGEAVEWRLLSILFEYPASGWRERLTAVAREVRDQRLKECADSALTQASAGMHHSIFGPGGPVSPREATYTSGIQLGYLLSEISGFYEAFAYRPETEEPVDHVSVAAGFVGYLRVKQAYALSCGEEDKAAIAAEAAGEFLREHMSRLAAAVAAGLEPIAPDYLVTAGAVLSERAGPARIDLGTFAAAGDEENVMCGEGC
jgi:nitrate reductase assembly molybdenum cofactor insertion protein NarJ